MNRRTTKMENGDKAIGSSQEDPAIDFNSAYRWFKALIIAGATKRDAEKIINDPDMAKRLVDWMRSGHHLAAPPAGYKPSQPPPASTRRVALDIERMYDIDELFDAPGMRVEPALQVERWRELNADARLNLCIDEEHFRRIPVPPQRHQDDVPVGMSEIALCYGFGFDDGGNADLVESLRRSWHILKYRLDRGLKIGVSTPFKMNVDYFHLRPNAAPRPPGFFWAKIQLGWLYQGHSLELAFQRMYRGETAMAHEPLQIFSVTHPQLLEEFDGVRIPFLMLGGFMLAPNGNGDFSNPRIAPLLKRRHGDLVLEEGLEIPHSQIGLATMRM
ncbi:MAG: hypothetical protein PHW53_02920 [Patescibacteria group bacterium]|nr:hypothetical protein [Patescibacteria group bacterium]